MNAMLGDALMASVHRIELRLVMLPVLPGTLSEWWDSLTPAGISRRTAKKLNELLYHTIELARNALACSEDALVIASVSESEMTIVFADSGPGFDPVSARNHSHGGGFGFCHAFLFADAFKVESFGRRYEKRGKALVYTGESHVKRGSRIILNKALPVA